jgi:hypothetical protein
MIRLLEEPKAEVNRLLTNEILKTAEEADWVIDGYAVHEEMYKFCKAIRKSNSKVRFLPKHIRGGVANAMLMHLENADYAYGSICVGTNWGKSQASDLQYVVQHDSISNDKYKDYPYTDRLYSTNIDTAVKNVKRYCIPPTPVQVAASMSDQFSRATNDIIYNANRDVRTIVPDLRDHYDDLVSELKNLRSQNVVFSTQLFSNLFNELDKLEEKRNVVKSSTRPVYYVQVDLVGDNQFIHLVEAEAENTKYGAGVNIPKNAMTTLPSNDVPEDVMGRLSVLFTLQTGQHIPDVGMRISEKMFWLYRDTL